MLLNQSVNCNFFCVCVPSQIFSNMPDSSAPPVPPPRITPRKRQPITISKRPPRVFQALSHDHFQHTESNYQPLVWLSSSSSSLSHPVSAECFSDVVLLVFFVFFLEYSQTHLQGRFLTFSEVQKNVIYCTCVFSSNTIANNYYLFLNMELFFVFVYECQIRNLFIVFLYC